MSARVSIMLAVGLVALGALYLWITRGPAILLDMSWLKDCL